MHKLLSLCISFGIWPNSAFFKDFSVFFFSNIQAEKTLYESLISRIVQCPINIIISHHNPALYSEILLQKKNSPSTSFFSLFAFLPDFHHFCVRFYSKKCTSLMVNISINHRFSLLWWSTTWFVNDGICSMDFKHNFWNEKYIK